MPSKSSRFPIRSILFRDGGFRDGKEGGGVVCSIRERAAIVDRADRELLAFRAKSRLGVRGSRGSWPELSVKSAIGTFTGKVCPSILTGSR